MNELIQMMTDGRLLVVPIIGAIVFGVKCLVSSQIDLFCYSFGVNVKNGYKLYELEKRRIFTR